MRCRKAESAQWARGCWRLVFVRWRWQQMKAEAQARRQVIKTHCVRASCGCLPTLGYQLSAFPWPTHMSRSPAFSHAPLLLPHEDKACGHHSNPLPLGFLTACMAHSDRMPPPRLCLYLIGALYKLFILQAFLNWDLCTVLCLFVFMLQSQIPWYE